MAWTKLDELALGRKPEVIAGPILRKVTPDSVTVWLALRIEATAVLSVRDPSGVLVMQGQRKTVAIGKHLHIVAVTAKDEESPLREDKIYQYDISFTVTGRAPIPNLAIATGNRPLGYLPFSGPTFALPPSDLSRVRIIQGSCRMPHAGGKDMLAQLDALIAADVSKPLDRPQQLLLTGDQIYADDVADALLLMLSDAANVLLGWDEIVPVPPHDTPRPASALPPALLRFLMLQAAGFTSVDLRSHLITLGEYLCMYLFVWSDVLWPPALPAPADIDENVKKVDLSALNLTSKQAIEFVKNRAELTNGSVDKDSRSLTEFLSTLWQVRRALANIPTYMIFDDHEVTDDWNMTRSFCTDVYGSAFGRRIVQNALVAYSLCQHWGNAPEQFDAPGTPAGLKLLETLDIKAPKTLPGMGTHYTGKSPELCKLLGVKENGAFTRPENALTRGADSLQYHFTVREQAYQVIFTDGRTWRAFPGSKTHPIAKDQIKRQIVDGAEPNRLLLVVLSTNAPPVQAIRTAEDWRRTTSALSHYPDIHESWGVSSLSFQYLLTALTEKLPGQRRGAVILLSGDVHHSFATRLLFHAKKRFEDPNPATAVIAQLVASSFKNQAGRTLALHREGYKFTGEGFLEGSAGWVLGSTVTTEHFFGWGATANDVLAEMPFFSARLQPPVMPLFRFNPAHTKFNLPPHYGYRLDYISPVEGEIDFDAMAEELPASSGKTPAERRAAAKSFYKAGKHFRMFNALGPPVVVGRNNFGEIRFDWGATGADRKVHHIIRWLSPKAVLRQTKYTISLNPDDPDFKDIRAVVDP